MLSWISFWSIFAYACQQFLTSFWRSSFIKSRRVFFLKKFYVAMPQFPFFLIYNFIKSDTASVTIFFILYFCNILIPYNAHFFHFDKCILSFWEYHYIHIVPLLVFTPTQSFFFRKRVFRFLQPDISRNI